MKKALLYSLLALLTVLNGATGRAFQANKASAIKTSRPSTKTSAPCVGKAGRRLPNKDTEVKSLVAHVESFTNALVRLVNDAANPADGADAAQRYLNNQKPGLSAEFAAAKAASGCQVSRRIKESTEGSFYEDGVKLRRLYDQHGADPAVAAKLKKLIDDFLGIVGATGEMGASFGVGEIKAPCENKSGEMRDADLKNFVAAINSFTDELVAKVEAGPTPAAGVDEAQRHMDKEKERVRAMFNDIKGIGKCKVSGETWELMKASYYQDGVKMGQLTARHGSDPAVKTKLQKLTQDFLALFRT